MGLVSEPSLGRDKSWVDAKLLHAGCRDGPFSDGGWCTPCASKSTTPKSIFATALRVQRPVPPHECALSSKGESPASGKSGERLHGRTDVRIDGRHVPDQAVLHPQLVAVEVEAEEVPMNAWPWGTIAADHTAYRPGGEGTVGNVHPSMVWWHLPEGSAPG